MTGAVQYALSYILHGYPEKGARNMRVFRKNTRTEEASERPPEHKVLPKNTQKDHHSN
jgi:ribosomal 50S subunit-associated protein YjgA (DUF615 family)